MLNKLVGCRNARVHWGPSKCEGQKVSVALSLFECIEAAAVFSGGKERTQKQKLLPSLTEPLSDQ